MKPGTDIRPVGLLLGVIFGVIFWIVILAAAFGIYWLITHR